MDKTRNEELTKKRWLVLLASCLINLCIGSLYAWSVFATPLADRLNDLMGNGGKVLLTAANLGIVFTVANSVGPITMISGGAMNEKLGMKKVVFIGGLLFGCGLLGSSFASSIPALILFYGLGCGLGMGMVYGCTISNSVKFFPDKRGLIGGIATATYGLSSVLIPPIANQMIQRLGVEKTLLVLGIVFLVLICLCSFLIDSCPADFLPTNGWKPKENTGLVKRQDYKWNQMLKDKRFYLMLLMLLCGAFSGLMITSQASPMAQKMAGMTAAKAATAVSILALFNASGRILSGYLSDKLGRSKVLIMAFVLELIGLFSLLNVKEGDEILFYLGLSIMGFCFGSFMGIYPGFTADQFGAKNNGVNYGIMFIGFALAGFFGPTVVGKIVNTYGSYQKGFFVAMGTVCVGIILSFVFSVIEENKIKK